MNSIHFLLIYIGTNLNSIKEILSSSCIFHILFSDGMDTLCGEVLAPIAPSPIHTVCSEKSADHLLLKRWSLQTGGTFFERNSTV